MENEHGRAPAGGMTSERDRMVRNSALIALQRAGLLAVGLLYALVVPRALGPEDYGRFSLLASMSTLFFVLGDLGLPQALSRHLQVFLSGADRSQRRAFLGVLVRVRVLVGLLAALAFLWWVAHFFPDLPAGARWMMAGGVVCGSLADPLLSWLLGRNRADRWGWSFLLRRAQYLVLIPLGYRLAGLSGAAAGVLLAEAIVLAYAFFQDEDGFDLRAPSGAVPRAFWLLALGFLAGNMVSGLYRFSGETLVKWAGCDYHEVGYFGLGLNVLAAAEAGFIQLLAATNPFLSAELAAGRTREAARWLERLLVILLGIAGCGLLAACWLAEPLVPRIFGAAFTPVATLLPLVAATLVAASVGNLASSAALQAGQPRVYVASAALRLALFWILGLPAAQALGAYGAWVAALVANAAGAALATVWIRRAAPYRLRYLLLPLLFLVPAVLLAAGGGAVRGLAALGLFVGLLLAGQLVTREEWIALRRVLRGGREKTT